MPTNSLTVVIGDVEAPGVLRFEQIAAFGLHTVATLDLKVTAWNRPWVAPEWTPVTTRIGDGSVSSTWYGYVHHGGVVADSRDVAGSAIRYTLIGTSLPMNQEQTRSWKNATASSIVRQIANEHRLRTVISPFRSPMAYYAQAGSDWKVLQDLATKTGYRLWVDGSTLRFVDAKVLLRGAKVSDIPVFTHSSIAADRGNLYQFQSKVGTMVPRASGRTVREVVMGIDTRTNTIVKASSSSNLGSDSPIGSVPLMTKVNTGLRVGTFSQAIELVGASTINSQGWLSATAIVSWTPTLEPGAVVEFAGDLLPEDQQGLWFVTGVTHRVLRDASMPVDAYTTIVEVERDQFYSPTFSSDFKVNNTRDVVAATIRNGFLWESEYMENINVG